MSALPRPAAPVPNVAIFAPSGYDADPDRLERAAGHFDGRGAAVTRAFGSGRRHGRFAGTEAERLEALRGVIDDPAIDVAIALRGGYGATRLLPAIDFAAMARAVRGGKRFVGHSDFTAISLGLLATTGAISFAGPMAGPDFGGDAIDAFTERHFWTAMRDARVDATFDTATSDALAVEGTLWGGNLAMIASLVGTPWLPRIAGGILFVEDVGEQPYRVERMLLQLQQAGILDRQRLVLCGDFTGQRATDYDDDYDLDAAFDFVRGTTATPIVAGLPFGHGPRKLTLAVGARAEVGIAAGRCRLRQAWDLAAT